MENYLSSKTSPVNKSADSSSPKILGSGAWDRVREVLSRELSDQSFQTWIEPVACVEFSEIEIKLGVPDNYYGIWLKNHYEELIKSTAKDLFGSVKTVLYEVVSTIKPADSIAPSVKPNVTLPAEKKGSTTPSKTIGLNNKYTFDQFVIGPGNRFAHAAAMAVAEAPAKNYNPLFIYGPVGLGKTHLMQSIAQEIKRVNPDFKILYISSEKFTNQLISSIQTRSTQAFRSRYRSLDLLLIDDIHFIAGKESTQEEFFHTFNTLYDAHKQIVVSSDRPPKEIPSLEERLVSRFGWGLVTDIQPPDFETRVAILKKKMEKETVFVPDDVMYFIASKIKSNIRELEGALIRVVAYCTLTGESMSLKIAQDILQASVKEEEQNITIEKIQRLVAEYYNLNVSDLRSKSRSKSIAKPRQMAMYLIRTLTPHSLPEIGEYFGGRDHTTVLHAVNKITKEKETIVDTIRQLEEIKSLLTGG